MKYDASPPAAQGSVELRVYADPGELAEAAARLFADEARRAIGDKGEFSVALAGGTTPQAAYGLLARPPRSTEVAWGNVHVFWGDERCVHPDDRRSNERMVRRTLLDQVSVPSAHVHPMRCGGESDCEEAAARYEAELRRVFDDAAPAGAALPIDGATTASAAAPGRGLDLLLLGLGEDGHTASLFPGSPVLRERSRWVSPSWGAGLARLTLTLPFISLARRIVFLVAGSAKAPAVKRVLEGSEESDAALPARLVRPVRGQITWLLDEQSASLLSFGPHDAGVISAYRPNVTTSQEGPL